MWSEGKGGRVFPWRGEASEASEASAAAAAAAHPPLSPYLGSTWRGWKALGEHSIKLMCAHSRQDPLRSRHSGLARMRVLWGLPLSLSLSLSPVPAARAITPPPPPSKHLLPPDRTPLLSVAPIQFPRPLPFDVCSQQCQRHFLLRYVYIFFRTKAVHMEILLSSSPPSPRREKQKEREQERAAPHTLAPFLPPLSSHTHTHTHRPAGSNNNTGVREPLTHTHTHRHTSWYADGRPGQTVVCVSARVCPQAGARCQGGPAAAERGPCSRRRRPRIGGASDRVDQSFLSRAWVQAGRPSTCRAKKRWLRLTQSWGGQRTTLGLSLFN